MFARWRATRPLESMSTMFGTLVSEIRQVTPAVVVAAHSLLEEIIRGGCDNGVVYPSKLLQAVKAVLARDAVALKGKTCDELLASQIVTHVQMCLGALRSCKSEDASYEF